MTMLSKFWIKLCINLYKVYFAIHLKHNFLKQRHQLQARTAPFCPKINKHKKVLRLFNDLYHKCIGGTINNKALRFVCWLRVNNECHAKLTSLRSNYFKDTILVAKKENLETLP